RDLRYRDAQGVALVFRFISEDGVDWQSLGAWEDVTLPDDLGDPVSAEDAAARFPCAAGIVGSPSILNWQRGGITSSLATIVQDMPLSLPRTLPAPMPVPMPAPKLSPAPAAAPTQYPSSTPRPYRSQDFNSNPDSDSDADSDTDSSPGPTPGGPQPRTPAILSCPPKTEPCQLLSYAQFIAQLRQAIQAEHDNDFQRAITLLTQHGVMVAQLPSLEVSRAAAVRAIVELEIKTINIVEARLHDDVSHLEPFESDSSEVKSKHMAIIEHDDQELRKMWKHAVEANSPAAADSFSAGTFRFDSGAYQQLVQIHLSGNWPAPPEGGSTHF
ncbi:MAG: hypothetical protein WBP85_15060, partial [Terracidiphilus sp.]